MRMAKQVKRVDRWIPVRVSLATEHGVWCKAGECQGTRFVHCLPRYKQGSIIISNDVPIVYMLGISTLYKGDTNECIFMFQNLNEVIRFRRPFKINRRFSAVAFNWEEKIANSRTCSYASVGYEEEERAHAKDTVTKQTHHHNGWPGKMVLDKMVRTKWYGQMVATFMDSNSIELNFYSVITSQK